MIDSRWAWLPGSAQLPSCGMATRHWWWGKLLQSGFLLVVKSCRWYMYTYIHTYHTIPYRYITLHYITYILEVGWLALLFLLVQTTIFACEQPWIGSTPRLRILLIKSPCSTHCASQDSEACAYCNFIISLFNADIIRSTWFYWWDPLFSQFWSNSKTLSMTRYIDISWSHSPTCCSFWSYLKHDFAVQISRSSHRFPTMWYLPSYAC